MHKASTSSYRWAAPSEDKKGEVLQEQSFGLWGGRLPGVEKRVRLNTTKYHRLVLTTVIGESTSVTQVI